MAYAAYTLNDFSGGLNLKAKADEVAENESVYAVNVMFTEGSVKQRPGYTALTSSTLTNPAGTLHPFYTSSGTTQLLGGCGTRLEAINTSGGVVASLTGLTSTGNPWFWDFCRVGTASAEYAYAGNGENVLKRWSGSAWSSIANTPQGGALCVTPSSNRLVATRFKGTTGGPTGGAGTSNPSRVYFSDPGAPETWTSTNYVDLDPGDGEVIQAAITWREYIFVFKESKFYVFTGESTDADGNPVFNYRKIDTGAGLVAPRAVVAGDQGVYFANQDGIYITTGEAPTKISEKLDPVFYGGEDQFAYWNASNAVDWDHPDYMTMGLWRGLLIVGYLGISPYNYMVYHTEDGWWSIWNLGDGGPWGLATFRRDGIEELVFGGVNHIYYMDGTDTDDAGSTIVAAWRSGYMDFGVVERKRLRQIRLWGSGDPKVGVTVDYVKATTTADTATIDLGTDAADLLNPGIYRTSKRGTVFSLYLLKNTGTAAWSVHRAIFHLAGSRLITDA